MSAYPTPTAPGFYWAKWKIASEGTRDGDQLTPNDRWEPVEVAVNSGSPEDQDRLRVDVPGVERSQSLSNFFWGPELIDPSKPSEFSRGIAAAVKLLRSEQRKFLPGEIADDQPYITIGGYITALEGLKP